jgi:pilus assembly protein CpaF
MLSSPDLHDKLLKALGPLAALYTDPTYFEIYVDSYQRIYADRRSILDPTGVCFDTPQALQQMISDILALYHIQPAPGQTEFDLRLDERTRMQIVLPPVALKGPYVVIRKLPEAQLSWEMLIEWGMVNRPMVDLLQEMIYQSQNILVVGGRSSNKLTTAALLAGRLPLSGRVAVVEREHEMQVNHPNAVFLEANGADFAGLIRTAARMTPGWLVINDLAGPEAMTVMELLSRGFYGIATLYASGVEDALKRLEMLCLMANPGLGLQQIRTLIAAALQVIVFQQQVGPQDSKIVSIVELVGADEGHYLLQPLYTYNLSQNTFDPSGVEPTWRQKD